jgi:RNA polymerase sigma-70 factor (ECF subfamily)
MKDNLILLVIKTQLQDRDALDALLSEIESPLYSFINRIIKDPDSSKDVLQNTLVIICKKIKWLNNPAAFKSWTYSIAFRESLKFLKREKIHLDINQYYDFQEINNDLETNCLPNVNTEILPQIIDKLSPASKLVIEMHFYEGLKLQEVADILDISIGTVKSRLNYGLLKLRGLI